jgi:acyl carrier protein
MADAEAVLEFIREELLETDEEIDADTSLFRSQLLDSISLTGLIVFLEEHFGIRVGAMDISYDNLDTVNLMLRFVEAKRVASV